MAQVKFYSVASDATRSDTNGIYFVTGGELYKGTSRFGANKVFTAAEASTLDAATAGIVQQRCGMLRQILVLDHGLTLDKTRMFWISS